METTIKTDPGVGDYNSGSGKFDFALPYALPDSRLKSSLFWLRFVPVLCPAILVASPRHLPSTCSPSFRP